MECVVFYREYFSEKGIYENSVYPYIPELLKFLKNRNKFLIVATSKPTVFAEKILRHFHLDGYFDYVSGCSLNLSLSDKTDIIRYVLENHTDGQKNNVLMIGDREHDIIGAESNGIDSLGVLYGYEHKGEIRKIKPTYIADQPEDLYEMILKSFE